jgi:hypothetical protein
MPEYNASSRAWTPASRLVLKSAIASSCRSRAAVATCSARGAHVPTWLRKPFMASITSLGPRTQPTRTPVAANAFEMPSTRIVYRAISGRSDTGSTCTVSPNVSCQ